jgi:hypothetical protein
MAWNFAKIYIIQTTLHINRILSNKREKYSMHTCTVRIGLEISFALARSFRGQENEAIWQIFPMKKTDERIP